MNEYMEIYIAETKELLDDMNDSLLKLEKNKGDTGLFNTIFRAAHTIKGNSASMGFKRMENLTHSMEDVLQDIREGKVGADGKVIELLFVCHDFLESGLCTIMQTGNEEDMKIDEILSKLHSIIKEKHERLKTEAACPSEKNLDSVDLTLNDRELYNLKKSIDAGLYAYLIRIAIADDCIFKSVRVWMWFQEIDAFLNIIKSYPDRPESESIKDNSYVFGGNAVKLVAASKDDQRQLLGKLNKLLDAQNICVESLKPEDIDFAKNQVKLVMTKAALSIPDVEQKEENTEAEAIENKDRLIEIESEFSNDFMSEISAQLSKVEENLNVLDKEPENNNAIYKLSRLFHTIKGLAGFIDSSLIVKISGTAELLVEYYRKCDSELGNTQIELFTRAAAFIRKLCVDKSLFDNSTFADTVKEHIDSMKIEMYSEIQEEGKKSEDIALETEPPEDNSADNSNLIKEENFINSLHNQAEQVISKNAGKSIDSSFMRVSAQKIDSLADMLGELQILHSLMEQEASERFDSNDRYMNNLLRMAKIIKGIQSLSMSLRMVSLKQAFQKTMRVGRDTASELGKRADIVITGEETEIDRNIADRLVDPLMHLIRNAVSHGIEPEAERIKSGKSEAGHINIQAYSKRGHVYVEVEDDGGGLSIEKIHSKAIEKKLVDPNLNYSTEEIMKFIFLPGFSTQDTVDNISGRGVGMNVVETEIKKVGGKIDIINKIGEGCKFVLKIPLNLAAMNGTIVDIYGGRYIIPTIYIKQFLKPDPSQWVKVKNIKSMIRVRDDIIQVIPVNRIFDMEGSLSEEDEKMVIIMEVEQKLKALPVRSVIGRQEIVAKPLGKDFGGLDITSGASILGDGKVSLILDIEALFKINNNSIC